MSENNTICWVDIPVVDLDRAIAFYSAVFGSTVSKEAAGPGCFFGLLPHSDNNVSGCLTSMGDSRPSEHGALVYLNVSGRLDDAAGAVTAGGGKILQPKHSIGPHGFRVIVLDTEGNRIVLHSPTA